MPQPNRDIEQSPHEAHMQQIAKRVREINRPTLLGDPPSADLQRDAYIFTQTIRSDAERQGIPYHSLNHFVVYFCCEPEIPKPKQMQDILADANAYIKQSTATNDASECVLYTDDAGVIKIRKSTSFPSGFNYRFTATETGG